MKKLFYQNYRKLNGSVDPEESKYEIHEALTIHPFKNHTYLYKMQQYVYKQKLLSLQKKKKKIENEIMSLQNNLKDTFHGTTIAQNNVTWTFERHLVNEWTAYRGKSYFSHVELNPKHAIEEPEMKILIDTIFETEKQKADKMKKYSKYFHVKNFDHGYKHISPLGMKFLINLKVCCLTERQHILEEDFVYLAIRNLLELHISEEKNIEEHSNPKTIGVLHEATLNVAPMINFIIPLSGKLLPFLNFINNFEKIFLHHGKNVSLLVILFWNNNNQKDSWEIVSSIKNLKKDFSNFQINIIQKRGVFNRGNALNIGASVFNEDDLLFFVDVDCFIYIDILKRIILNTIQYKQAYFPIMFSLYKPELVWENNVNFNNFTFSEELGYWRYHSFGQLSVFKSDFTNIGGYDSNIRGWGKEDIDLFQKFLDKGVIPFRAPDPGIIHIFHDVHCGLELPHEQYRMCLGTKWSTFGCQKTLSNIVYSSKELFDRNKEV